MTELTCNTEYIGKQYIWVEETDSTNSLMRRLINDGASVEGVLDSGMLIEGNPPEGSVILADSQTAGRGRSGHSWNSQPGSSISMSILLRPELEADSIPVVTLVTGLAVCRAIEINCGLDCEIKWPNDIVINGRKVCGILTELNINNGDRSLIVGVGINANQDSFPEEIRDIATSLRLETGDMIDRVKLVADFLEALESYYKVFLATGDMSVLKKEYEQKLVNINREVRVLDPSMDFTGVARGIDDSGRLLVEARDGSIRPVYAGEVSVRGIYGYV